MLAYTQARVPVLVQLVSVTGLWGLTFVLVWFATVVNWAFEHRQAGRRVLPGVAVYAAVLVAILGFGALRLAGAGSVGEPVRVAGITVAGDVATGREAGLSRLMKGEVFANEDWRAFAEASRAVNEELLRLSEREAAKGGEAPPLVRGERGGAGRGAGGAHRAAAKNRGRVITTTAPSESAYWHHPGYVGVTTVCPSCVMVRTVPSVAPVTAFAVAVKPVVPFSVTL